MIHEIDDVRIQNIRPLMAPEILIEDLPVGEKQNETIFSGRREIEKIIAGEDDRLVLVVGPCSIHDPEAGMEYAAFETTSASSCACISRSRERRSVGRA